MRLPKYLKKKIKMQTRQSPNRETLVRLAVRVGIPEANQMSKTALYDRLNSECNFERLMRAEIRRSCKEAKSRKRKRSRERSKRTSQLAETADSEAKRIKLNKIDPIMLAPIGKKETFKFSRPNGTKVQFNVDTLVDYLLTSGDFHDPETRLPFSDDDLREIDRIAQSNGYAKASVYDARQNATLFSEAKFRRDALLALERCAGEVISEILEVVETFEPEDAQMELVTQQFPIFQDYYRQMKKADHSYASKCLAHWNAFIKGPPNHPNDDEYGFIRIVINFLKACENEPISA